MYCVKCGVELANSEERCPLCGITAYHPEIKEEKGNKPYPPFEEPKEKVNAAGMLFIMTVIFVLPLIITVTADLVLSSSITWSGYVVGGLCVIYAVAVLPYWFSRPNPVIFVPVDFVILGLFLLYINIKTEGSWFLTFALPITLGAMVITTAVISLIRYVRKGYLFIIGGAFIFLGGYMLLIELLINITFDLRNRLIWSYYPFGALVLIGIALIAIGCSKTLRESLYKKFFI